jgi:uncharacterized protein YyaL (SSP411 family)
MKNHSSRQNQLISETSPYLLQHANNPVNWHPWSDLALDKAHAENKLIIVSIGYSACHWCHVMEKESFEDEEVAHVMNNHYVSIKVDREERPDIDQIYMNAIQLLSGQGGWPLNCIALPDGSPVYSGTYFPKQQWLQVLETLATMWHNEPKKLLDQAEQLKQGITETELITEPKEPEAFDKQELVNAVNQWKYKFDRHHGGEDYAPKFPMPDNHQFLMQYAKLENDHDTLNHVLFTLGKMADGGIYDHLRGGFARYSVDKSWFVPHFEKMLYDNAQLVSLYSRAFQLTKDEAFRNVAYETLEFVSRELTSPDGGFYSSLDADSEGVEGKYYVWKLSEIQEILANDAGLFCDYYGITETGNWEHGKNILNVNKSFDELQEKHGISSSDARGILETCRKKLFEQQNKRVPPQLDDKIITSWNALMMKGFLDAYIVFKEEQFLDKALQNANFIKKNLLKPNHRLDRTFKNDQSKINAFLDDYSFLIDAFISMYQATFDEEWLHLAHNLVESTKKHFYDPTSGMFYYTSDEDRALVARKMELGDNVIASSNSSMAKNLFAIGTILENNVFIVQSKQMLTNVADQVYRYPKYYSNWGVLLLWHTYPYYEVAISGNNAREKQREWNEFFIPNHLVITSDKPSGLPLLKDRWQHDTTNIYVCRNNTCHLPVTDVSKAVEKITF